MLLPWITFAILFAALYVRMIRASVLESLDEDYVRTARAKGGSSLHVLRHHVLRNAAIPVVTLVGMDVGLAFAGRCSWRQSLACRGWAGPSCRRSPSAICRSSSG